MSRIRRVVVYALVALALLGAGAAFFPPGPTFNPQPDPPGVTFNPQPDPPGAAQGAAQAGVTIHDSLAADYLPGPSKMAGVIINQSPAA